MTTEEELRARIAELEAEGVSTKLAHDCGFNAGRALGTAVERELRAQLSQTQAERDEARAKISDLTKLCNQYIAWHKEIEAERDIFMASNAALTSEKNADHARITELEAEIARQKQEWNDYSQVVGGRIASLESANAELTKKLAEAKNALKPFAKEAEAWGGSSLDDYHPGILEPNQRTAHADAEFSIGDLRHAAAILANQKGGDANEGTPSTTNTPESSPGVTAGALAQARDAALEEASEIAHDIGFQRASDGYTKAKSRTGRDKANAASRCALEIEDAIRSLKTKGE